MEAWLARWGVGVRDQIVNLDILLAGKRVFAGVLLSGNFEAFLHFNGCAGEWLR